MPFAVCVTFEIDSARMPDFLPLMHENATASLRDEEGCLQFDVLTDPARPDEVFLYEIYTDAAAFEAHLRSAHFLRFDEQVAPMLRAKAVKTYTGVTQ